MCHVKNQTFLSLMFCTPIDFAASGTVSRMKTFILNGSLLFAFSALSSALPPSLLSSSPSSSSSSTSTIPVDSVGVVEILGMTSPDYSTVACYFNRGQQPPKYFLDFLRDTQGVFHPEAPKYILLSNNNSKQNGSLADR